jgi:Domain of unknown function (DUF4349)
MRRLDDYPIDPDIAAQLDAIDATLAGDPVDPEHAELAELALLLAGERREPSTEFSRSLDERVARRFAPAPQVADAKSRWWLWKSVGGTLAAGVAAIGVVALIGSSGGGSVDNSSSASVPASAASTTLAHSAPVRSAAASSAGTSSSSGSGGVQATKAPAPQPQSNGRKIVQSAQLALVAPANRIDSVAQEAFDVIGRENGIVSRSTVTATGGSDGYAQFDLRVPSSSLSQTMSALSSLHYAHVSSRTDNTQDVNDAYVSVNHRLADARALRTALLKQLAQATTQQQIDSLTARIHDAEASIASYEATIRGLNRRINFSDISLTINAGSTPTPVSHGGGFTLGKAAHDAGRVLTVAAGVALIALAALVPVALIVALGLWIGAAIRRRRREQALDAA